MIDTLHRADDIARFDDATVEPSSPADGPEVHEQASGHDQASGGVALAAAPVESSKRKRLFLVIGAVVLLAAIAFGLYDSFVLSTRVSSDNAYVGAETAQITPLVGGAIKTVEVSDTQSVKRGQILMTIDDSDARIALDQAQANLAMAMRKYGETAASGEALSATADARQADVLRARAQLASAQGDIARAQVDYNRRQALLESGAVSGDELTTATNALRTAQANLDVARAGIAQAEANQNSAQHMAAANAALISGTTVATAPDVLEARAKVEQAKLDLERTVIRSPIDGVVAQRTVQVGQRIAPGAPVMTVVPIGQLYVDANYKEGQLGKVAVGQPAKLTSDLYGKDVVYHGRVVGFAGGTGSSFALIPAQNATGNWIKVVQRLPIRIALDPAELKAHPLRVGLSMSAEIDLSSH